MTPARITAKANAQHQRLRDAFQELQLVLDFKNLDVVQGINAHLRPVPAAPARPSSAAAASTAAAAPAVPTAPPALAHHSSSPARPKRESSADDAVLKVALALSLWDTASPPPAPSPPRAHSPPGQAAGAHGGFLWEIPIGDVKVDCTDPCDTHPRDLGCGRSSLVRPGVYEGDFEGRSQVQLHVAVKMALKWRLHAAEQDADKLRAFQHEVDFMCKLSHPHICACHGAVSRRTSGALCLWIVLERLDHNMHAAVVVHRSLPTGRQDPRLFASIMTGLVSALAYLHAPVNKQVFIHRHLQPSNILMTHDNVPKLSNFRAARVTSSPHDVEATVLNQLGAGPSEWMAPELRDNGVCSTASDVYALGLIGRFLWAGLTPTQLAQAQQGDERETSEHALANYALHLLRACCNPAPRYRPAAASISLELCNFRPVQAHLSLPVAAAATGQGRSGSLQGCYVEMLRRSLRLVELTPLAPELKDVCEASWSVEDVWRVGGITGLMDTQSFLLLKHSLWTAAGKPADGAAGSRLEPYNPATWSWGNLSRGVAGNDIVALAALQRHLGPEYVRRVEQPVNLLSVGEDSSNLMPLAQSLQARDKQTLFQRGNRCIVFDLDAATFQRPTQFNTPAALEELRRHLCPHSDKSVQLLASPCSHVTVSEQTRITAGIPAGAVFFCFCYPLAATSYMLNQSSDTVSEDMKARMAALQAKVNTADPFACLLMAGAFLYLDEVYDVVAINSVYFAEVPAAMRHLNSVIHLGRGSALPRAAALALGEGGRFLPVTAPRLLAKGFTHFAWISPSEVLTHEADSWVFQRRGGFAYRHRDAAKSCFYPVVPMLVGAPENDWYAASAPDKLRFLCPGTDDPSSSPRNLRVRAADAPLAPPQDTGPQSPVPAAAAPRPPSYYLATLD